MLVSAVIKYLSPIIFTFLLGLAPTVSQTCISHRVNLGGAPENSLEGIRRAVRESVTGIEFDIRLSKDGVPILYHDRKLGDELKGHNCPRGKRVKSLNIDKIIGSCFLENGEPLPTLQNALDELIGYSGHIFIDLKPKMSEVFYQLIEDSWIFSYSKVRYLSFKKRGLRPLRKRWPQAKTLLLSILIPRGLFYDGVGFNKGLKVFIGLFRLLGKDLGLWTLNSKRQIIKAIKKKTDFIISDEYLLCRNTLEDYRSSHSR